MSDQKLACSHDIVEVDDDNGLSCPPKGSTMWNAHPRVYLSMPAGCDRVRCYYCGTLYVRKVRAKKSVV